MDANNMNPDQNAPKGATNLIWVHIVCNTGHHVHKQMGEQMEDCHEWRVKGLI